MGSIRRMHDLIHYATHIDTTMTSSEHQDSIWRASCETASRSTVWQKRIGTAASDEGLGNFRQVLVEDLRRRVEHMIDNMDDTLWEAVINQSVIESTAELLVSTGLRDAGYNFLVVDDGWQNYSRAADGRRQPNATRFPGSIADLAAKVHDAGLKFGIYSDGG